LKPIASPAAPPAAAQYASRPVCCMRIANSSASDTGASVPTSVTAMRENATGRNAKHRIAAATNPVRRSHSCRPT
jgi:hypothetical protein